MNIPLRTADPAVWRLVEMVAEQCLCPVHGPSGRGCPGGDCDGCLSCPTGRARAIIVLEEA